MTVVATHLALRWVEIGRVGEGGRHGVIIHGGVRVARWGKQRLGVGLGVVVLILARGGSAAVSQSLPLGQLVAQRRHPLLFLQMGNRRSSVDHLPPFTATACKLKDKKTEALTACAPPVTPEA